MDLLDKLGAIINGKEKIIKIGKLKSESTTHSDEVKIAIKHLSGKEGNALLKLCNNYRDVFRKSNQHLPCTNTVKHEQ